MARKTESFKHMIYPQGGPNRWPATGPGELPPSTGTIQPPFGAPSGPSAGPSDTVPAWLTPGEAVLNRNAAQLAGRGNINALNRMGGAMGYQSGTDEIYNPNRPERKPFSQLIIPDVNRVDPMTKLSEELARLGVNRDLIQAATNSVLSSQYEPEFAKRAREVMAQGYQSGTGYVRAKFPGIGPKEAAGLYEPSPYKIQDQEHDDLTPEELRELYALNPSQWSDSTREKIGYADEKARGFAQGIGYVDPKDVDPIWQEIQLQAPGINVAALRQQAAKSGISGTQISGLINAFMKSRAGNMDANYQAAGSSTPVYGESGYPSAIPIQGYARGTENFQPPDLPPDNTFEPPNLNQPPYGGGITPPATAPPTSYYDDLHEVFNQPGLRFTPNAGQLYSQAMDRAANRIAQGLPPDITYEAGMRSGTPGGYGYNWGTGPTLPPGGGGIGPDAVYGINVGVPSGGLSWRGRSPGFGGRSPQQI